MPETFLLPNKFTGFFYIVYDQMNGKDKSFEKSRRVYNIPATGVLFTKFENDWGCIRYNDGVINQQFYFIEENRQRKNVKVLDIGDFNNMVTTSSQKEYSSKDNIAVFFISAGTISNGETILTTDQYYVGTYNDLTKTKGFTFQYIDSLRLHLTKTDM